MSTKNNSNFDRHRTLLSSPSQLSPTVPRVREDSPSAIQRPSSSSIPNLESLIEEEEIDHPCSKFVTKTLLPKQSTYQPMNKHRFNLPTIIESQEMLNESTISNTNAFTDEKHETYTVQATSTNLSNGFTINHLFESNRQRKSISVETDVDENGFVIPTTFKDISAFFENKTSRVHPTDRKKIVRARRSLTFNTYTQNANLSKTNIISSIDEESSIFHRQIKRIKRIHMTESDKAFNITRYWFSLLLLTNLLIGSIYICHVISTSQQATPNNENNQSKHSSCSTVEWMIKFIGQSFFR
ncbi:unnamed protein product [Adineta ricciae]|uniref:Uncharacterized protein n=1 Tax=Adineta ricciae TaxID=249248 RepID=A0A815I5G8_ADIRI|nr:unnamed protein product [Adineta ricciae]CAF1360960.1 unnamed protein product [Adineta ricciae]